MNNTSWPLPNIFPCGLPTQSRLGSLSKSRRQRQWERHQTKGLMSSTFAMHVCYKSLYISQPSSAKQQREMTKFYVYGLFFVFPFRFHPYHYIFGLCRFLDRLAYLTVDCSRRSIFSYFHSIVERASRIARELDASVKRETRRGSSFGSLRSPSRFHPHVLHDQACFARFFFGVRWKTERPWKA